MLVLMVWVSFFWFGEGGYRSFRRTKRQMPSVRRYSKNRMAVIQKLGGQFVAQARRMPVQTEKSEIATDAVRPIQKRPEDPGRDAGGADDEREDEENADDLAGERHGNGEDPHEGDGQNHERHAAGFGQIGLHAGEEEFPRDEEQAHRG